VRYFLSIAPGALAGIRDRPLVLKRFVDGAEGAPFYQKRAPSARPEWLRTATLAFPSGRTAEELVVDDAAGLAFVVNLGCIELHGISCRCHRWQKEEGEKPGWPAGAEPRNDRSRAQPSFNSVNSTRSSCARLAYRRLPWLLGGVVVVLVVVSAYGDLARDRRFADSPLRKADSNSRSHPTGQCQNRNDTCPLRR
jgi:hypothetical protein